MSYFKSVALLLVISFVAGCGDSSASDKGRKDKNETADKREKTDGNTSKTGDDTSKPTKADDGNLNKHALLIACTKYDFLGPSASLRGPGNDVPIMTKMLVERFGFSKHGMHILADYLGERDRRPTRANILREFKDMVARVKKGDQVVIYLSAHGSQQPDDDPNNKDDPEPDGMDEIFLPADTKPVLDIKLGMKPTNVIVDDEFKKWFAQMTDKGARLWVIADTCHSGTLIRGSEVLRQITPDQLSPPEAIAAAKAKVANTRGTGGPMEDAASPLDTPEDGGGIVAIYAAQPHEPTLDMPLPEGADPQVWQGLLTYTLVKVLSESKEPMTYDELTRRIHANYVTSGRVGPTPLVEGRLRHYEVLGQKEWPGRSKLTITRRFDGKYKIAAGSLYGLTKGTILAVYPTAGKTSDDKPLGHVRISSIKAAESIAESCAFGDISKAAKLPETGRCDVVQVDYGDLRLKVAVAEGAGDFADSVRKALKALSDKPSSAITYAQDSAKANWLVRSDEKGQVVLVPAGGWSAGSAGSTKKFGPVPLDGHTAEWLEDRLGRIARATNLLKVSGYVKSESHRGWLASLFGVKPRVKATLVRLASEDDPKGTPIKWKKGGVKLEPGTLVAIKVNNPTKHAMDVSLLFVDSGYGIESVFPSAETVADNRIMPGKSLTVGPLMVQDDSLGLEHLVLIAMKAKGQPADFGWLAQKSIERARSGAPGGNAAIASPIGQVLQNAMFAEGKTRGMKMVDTGNITLDVISWQTTSGK